MTVGIYKLLFKNTDYVYIGQSSNIEKRFTNHLLDMRNGTSSIKLQRAYKLYGMPSIEIICECNISDLNTKEYNYILQNNSLVKGFNSVKGGSSSGHGEDNPNAACINETYKEILLYLVETSLTNADIASIVETSESTVKHISDLSRHFWLEEEYPEMYNKLKALRELGTKKCAAALGIIYPSIKSPSGKIYEVTNVTKFAKEHGLASGALSMVLNKKSRTTQGWCLASDSIPPPIKIISPIGEEFYIGYRETKPFALKHGLHPSDLAKVIKGIAKQCKGWTLGTRNLDLSSNIK